jgi:hypothetical protein
VAKEWKDVLLRSGVPLEFEVAQVLAERGFEVDADFPYMRRDVEGEKEHSIDILATKFMDFGKERVSGSINLLIECKYRSPEKMLLLFEAPYSDNGWMAGRGTVHAYDEFVPYRLKGDCFQDFENGYDVVYKGVELHATDAVERDFKRSVEQLRYAAPVALRRMFDMTFFSHPADNGTWFFAKMIVTNAKLMLVKREVDVDKVQAASSLGDVAEEIGAAVLYSEYGPDYERHFRGVFEDVKEVMHERARDVAKYIKGEGKHLDAINRPTRKVREICNARRGACREISTQFLVCRSDAVDGIADAIVEGAKKAMRYRSKKSLLSK